AGKETQHGSALAGIVVADCAAQHRIPRFESVEKRARGNWASNLELHVGADVRQCSQVIRQDDSYHVNVCTSTDKTGGRCVTMGIQLSPESAETYTWPPEVPK